MTAKGASADLRGNACILFIVTLPQPLCFSYGIRFFSWYTKLYGELVVGLSILKQTLLR